jgi:DNA-binding Lrp family transcriptional regulator
MSTPNELDTIDRSILQFLQGNLPITSTPYRELSLQLGIQEEDIMKRIQRLIKIGIIKRIGAIPYHHSIGYTHNALVVWDIPLSSSSLIAEIVSEITFVSHCYFRHCPKDFPYPLFTMIHGTSELDLERKIQILSDKFQCSHYQVLKSKKEWKKTSMKYSFTIEGEQLHDMEK